MNSNRLERGIKKIQELSPNSPKKILNNLENIAPDLARYVLEFIFGDLYTRPGLDIKTKQMITITSLATLGNAKPQLMYHIRAALNLGITQQEIIDIMTHIAGYAGFPAALNGVAVAKEVFEQYSQIEKEKQPVD
jgi:4-carboxymuconolactone decarboxylase